MKEIIFSFDKEYDKSLTNNQLIYSDYIFKKKYFQVIKTNLCIYSNPIIDS